MVSQHMPSTKNWLYILICSVFFNACTASNSLTKSNRQKVGSMIRYTNSQLNLSIDFNGDYQLDLLPSNKLETSGRKLLDQSEALVKNRRVMFTGTTTVSPIFTVTGVFIPTADSWYPKGFEEVGPNRYSKSIINATEQSREYFFRIPKERGFFYLQARQQLAPKINVADQVYTMNIEYNANIFPSIRMSQDSVRRDIFLRANEAFFRRPTGDYLSPLVMLANARHDSNLLLDPFASTMLWNALLQYHSLAANTDSVEHFRRMSPGQVLIPPVAGPNQPVMGKAQQTEQEKLVTVDAIPLVLASAMKARGVFINESHYHSKHRLFVAQLLPHLYKQGYRYLALEALEDTTVNTRNYPVLSSGFYTREFTFANLVRSARKIGFTLISYEDSKSPDRELGQASKLYAALRHDQNARVVVFGGGDHMNKVPDQNTGKQWMALHFQKISKWDIVSVNQTKFGEDAIANLSTVPANSAQAILKEVNGKMVPISPLHDIYIRSSYSKTFMPLPFLHATNAKKTTIDTHSNVPAGRTRRMLQLYRRQEYNRHTNPCPVYTQELQAGDDRVTLPLCPDEYIYQIVISGNPQVDVRSLSVTD